MFSKKKKAVEVALKKEEKEDIKAIESKKQKRLPAEGSRFGALVLLFVCVLISMGFYLWGKVTTHSFYFDFGKSSSTWEFSK